MFTRGVQSRRPRPLDGRYARLRTRVKTSDETQRPAVSLESRLERLLYEKNLPQIQGEGQGSWSDLGQTSAQNNTSKAHV